MSLAYLRGRYCISGLGSRASLAGLLEPFFAAAALSIPPNRLCLAAYGLRVVFLDLLSSRFP